MLKLNRKGFTLVEVLAVVVVLSLVTGIAVPVTTHVVSNSKYRALGTIVDEAEEFIADQWRIKKMDPSTLNASFDRIMGSYTVGTGVGQSEFITLDVSNGDHKALISDMGIDPEKVTTVGVKIASDEIPCVVIGEVPLDSELYNSLYWEKKVINGEKMILPIDINNNSYYSKCCKFTDVSAFINGLKSR